MKKILAAALGLVLFVLVSVLLIRMILIKSHQVQAPPVTDLAVDARAAAEHLAGAVRFPTVSHENGANVEAAAFDGLHQYLQRTFPRVHAALSREVVGGYSLLYTWRGRRPELQPILLLSHQDVVPVEPGTEKDWTHPAFSGFVDGTWIWGRGTLDDKVGVMGILEAAELLLGRGFQPDRTVYLAFGHDEETGGSQGAAAIAALLRQRGVRPAFILDEGGAIAVGSIPGVAKPAAMVGTAEKGVLSVELVARGEGGHSSMPPPHGAIGSLAAAIAKLEEHQMPARLDGATRRSYQYLAPEMPFGPRLLLANLWLFAPMLTHQAITEPANNARVRTTTAPTIFQAGIKENVLPSEARAVVNFRTLTGDTIPKVLQHVRDVVGPGIRVRPTGSANIEASLESDVRAPEFGVLQRTLAETIPQVLVAPNLLSGSTDSKHYQALSPNIYRFVPMRLRVTDLKRIHGTDERLGIENYGEIVRFYAQLLRNGGV
ncbi:MAG TPA: M20 family peptidase [Thermoanaerobaculia bacterium]|jgi:carboxypeptidase PM20D1|nr:M20 family peptidase [Thermoanaerobaculia bacterium]